MQSLSIEAWALREGVDRRKAYRWVKSGKVPTVKRKIEVIGIPESFTIEELSNKNALT